MQQDANPVTAECGLKEALMFQLGELNRPSLKENEQAHLGSLLCWGT